MIIVTIVIFCPKVQAEYSVVSYQRYTILDSVDLKPFKSYIIHVLYQFLITAVTYGDLNIFNQLKLFTTGLYGTFWDCTKFTPRPDGMATQHV